MIDILKEVGIFSNKDSLIFSQHEVLWMRQWSMKIGNFHVYGGFSRNTSILSFFYICPSLQSPIFFYCREIPLRVVALLRTAEAEVPVYCDCVWGLAPVFPVSWWVWGADGTKKSHRRHRQVFLTRNYRDFLSLNSFCNKWSKQSDNYVYPQKLYHFFRFFSGSLKQDVFFHFSKIFNY